MRQRVNCGFAQAVAQVSTAADNLAVFGCNSARPNGLRRDLKIFSAAGLPPRPNPFRGPPSRGPRPFSAVCSLGSAITQGFTLMATKMENGRLILNGETLPEALEHLAAGKVDQDTVAEWLVGRTDIGIADVAAACFGPSARLRPTDLAFVDEKRRSRADAAAKAHGKKPPKLSYVEFLAEAGDIELPIGDATYTLKPRVFSTGTYGWFGQLKPGVVVAGEKLRTSANVCLYVAHSGFRTDAAEAKAYAKKVSDAKKAAGQSDDESDE